MEGQLKRSGMGISFLFLSLILSVFMTPVSEAQEFPGKGITLIYPFAPGGSHDLTMRALSSVAMDYLGQPLLIQSKPGGGGAIGTELVANAAPDGYTLVIGGPGWNTTLPAVEGRSKGPDDLAAVCRINYSPSIIFARADAPYKTFKEMIAWTKANPGKLIFGTTGPWGQADLAWKLIVHKTGIKTRVVPYTGGGPTLLAMLGGHIDLTGGLTSVFLPHVQAGKVRGLVVMDEKRHPDLPEVPTAKEEGVDAVYHMWRGILAPRKTPRPIIDKLASAFKKMTEDKSVISMIKQFGDQIQFLGPDEFTKVWRLEYESHKELGRILKK